MNENLSNKTIEWISKIGNVMAEEFPPFVSEAAAYGFISNLIGLVIFSCLLIFLLCSAKKFWIKSSEHYLLFSMLLFALSIIPFCASITCLDGMLRAMMCPKLYLIERLNK